MNACVLLRSGYDPKILIRAQFSFAKGLAKVKPGRIVDGSYRPL